MMSCVKVGTRLYIPKELEKVVKLVLFTIVGRLDHEISTGHWVMDERVLLAMIVGFSVDEIGFWGFMVGVSVLEIVC